MGGERVAIVESPGTEAERTLYVQNDHLGTPKVVTDSSKAVVWDGEYEPFGKVVEVSGGGETQRLRFPGQYEDEESGYYYNYFRDYDPSTDRYLQRDPTGLRGGINQYVYAIGNPVSMIDETGEISVKNIGDKPFLYKPEKEDKVIKSCPVGEICDVDGIYVIELRKVLKVPGNCYPNTFDGNNCNSNCLKESLVRVYRYVTFKDPQEFYTPTELKPDWFAEHKDWPDPFTGHHWPSSLGGNWSK